jgi:uncharacterized protein (DUF2236 family)
MTDHEWPEELRRDVMSGLGLCLAGANVIMQLSRLPVGRGVVEGSVPSGALHRHPIKRTRTTLGYVMIALLGTDAERAAIRREVNRQHRQVRSAPDSAVAYDAFDPELQLWVAACMYRGLEDAVNLLHGPPASATLDQLYGHCARFATTLQVPAARWPQSRESFEEYWRGALEHVAVDEVTRDYLRGLASLDFLPRPLPQLFGPAHRFLTAGFLADEFRGPLGLRWSPRRQRLFSRLCRVIAALNRRLPQPVREFPWNVSLLDARRRLRSGRPFV